MEIETNLCPMSSDMARQEIPSIVVHNGSSSSPDSHQTEALSNQPDSQATNETENIPVQEGNICFKETIVETVSNSQAPQSSSPLSATEIVTSPISSRTGSPFNDAEATGENQIEPEMAVGQCATSPLSPVDDGRSRSLDFHQLSTESEDLSQGTSSRTRHGPKKTLQRSHAMRDDFSPPPNMLEPCGSYPSHMGSNNSLTVDSPSANFRRPAMHLCSRQGSSDNSSIVSRCSPESGYTDISGINMPEFLAMTFNKSRKDRSMLLEIEQELIKLVEEKRSYHRFQPISSYHRMLVHRCAAYFGLGHASEQTGSGIVVSKEPRTRIPPYRFADLASQSNEKKSILQREYGSLEDSQYKNYRCIEGRRTKSLEEREEAYEKAKKRIFYSDMLAGYGGMECGRRYVDDMPSWFQDGHHRRYTDYSRIRNARPVKGESFDHDTLNVKSFRPNVFKSNSFGGYSDQGFHNLTRGNSVSSNPTMRIQKQDSMGRYSDYSNSSGYKTQRQDTSSTNVSNTLSETPSPTTGTSTMVQNGQPYVNADGTPYRFDPSNPPPMGKPPVNSKYQSKDRDVKTKNFDSKQESEHNDSEVLRSTKKNTDSIDTADEKSVKSEEESGQPVSRRCLESAQNVSELRGQLSALRVSNSSPDCASDIQSGVIGTSQHGRHLYSQPICYVPQPGKHYYPSHASAVDATGQSVAMPPVGIGMTLAHPTPTPVPSTDGSSYIPGNFTFVSILGTPNAPGAGQDAAQSPMYCAMPPAQALPLHGPVAPSSLPLQYSVPSSNASSCNILPYWHNVNNPQVYQPAAGLQAYPGQIFSSPAAAQPIPTPPPINPIHNSQGTIIPAGYAAVPGSTTSPYVMVPQHPHHNAQNYIRPPMQVQSPPPFPLFHCGGMQGPLPPCPPNPPFKPFMSASSHEPYIGVKDGHELKPYTVPGLPTYPPNHAHYGGQSYTTPITRSRYMQS